MYISKSFIPILKNNPSEAKIKSHQLMLRVGMIKQSSAGIYSWLPLGFKVMKKIEQIVREEQDKIGAQEILMPTIQPSDIWKESGRYDDYGEEMLRIKDRQNREMLYGPTNEELVTDIFRSSIKSYKSLPQLLYHIQWKFRDEVRPRFGIMRGREFYMKDAYSFDVNDDDAAYSYNKFFFSYLKTFKRLELSAIPMAADTGPIGGNLSHEFIILADTGESKIFTDKRIFDLDNDGFIIENRKSLESLRKKYEQYYAVADEKFDKEDFENKVLEENRLITKGIEVGHIFYFGDKYSKALNASVDLPGGKKDFVKMGSYGIGVSRLVGAIIEAKYDDKNEIMKWPLSVAPYECAIIPMLKKSDSMNINLIKSNQAYKYLISKNIDTIIDDSDENISSKIKKFNLIGAPFQIIIGNNSEGELFEFKEIGKDSQKLKIEEIANKIQTIKSN
jgi:prolyl-tRNA synthetase